MFLSEGLPVELSLRALMADDEYCDYGSCAREPEHTGEHRCQCGGLVILPRPSCKYHTKMPEPLTPRALMSYLETAADQEMIENRNILSGDRSIVDARVYSGRIVLSTFDEMIEMERR